LWASERVAKGTGRPVPRPAVYIAGAVCTGLTAVFLAIDVLHLGGKFFGWMVR
jgi:hypothetical protein